ncbi:MAG TPA: hypothetical protein PKE45_11295, partial [Caldilineaceae bacterium]|nr:hypothetical protein [Caldilineaceae bacterium]
ELVQLSQSCRDLPNAAPPALTSQLAATAKRADPAPAAIALAQPAEQAAGEPTPAATGCTGIPGESYSALSVASAPTDRPAASHPDFNLALRGYQPATASAALLDLYPAGDWLAPQLTGLLGDHRQPAINSAFQVFDWNWDCNCRGDLLSEPAVSLLGLRVSAGEAIYTPDSPRSLGDGYEALVLFATADALTLKFTREDNVVHGYTLHLLGLCVEPQLLALYTTLDSAGRATLPALRGGQPFGRARSDTLLVGIRDNGQFLEPRSLENWWR